MSIAHGLELSRRPLPIRALAALVLLTAYLVGASQRPASAAPGDVTIVSTGFVSPGGITSGSDGNLWITDSGMIRRMTLQGVVASFPDPRIAAPGGITNGPDGNLWFANGTSVGRITIGGEITIFSDPGMADVRAITAGADGNLWFTTTQAVGRITTDGAVSYFAEPGDFPVGYGIAAGADGNVWFPKFGIFSNSGAHGESIGRITPEGAITLFPDGAHLIAGDSKPSVMTPGPDGNVWFASYRGGLLHPEQGFAISRITPSGVTTTFTDPGIQVPWGITAGPDGNVWFTNETGVIGRVTPAGEFAWFAGTYIPPGRSITTGPDGNIWFTTDPLGGSATIGRVQLQQASAPGAGTQPATAVVVADELPLTGSDVGVLVVAAAAAIAVGGLAAGLAHRRTGR